MSVPEQYQRYARPAVVQPAEVELYGDRDPVVWIPGAYGEMVPVRKSHAPAPVQAAPVRDLTPQPLFDPLAQRLLAGLLLAAGMRGRSVTHVRQEVHNHARWFGRNETRL